MLSLLFVLSPVFAADLTCDEIKPDTVDARRATLFGLTGLLLLERAVDTVSAPISARNANLERLDACGL